MRMFGALALVVLMGCPGDDDEADDDPPPVEWVWSLPASELDPALLAVHPIAGDANDLLAVGGPLDGTGEPALRRRVSGEWTDLTPPAEWQGAMWWGWSLTADDVWVVGDRGQVARGAADALAMVPSGTSTLTVFYGVWGSRADDVYIVGGAPRARTGPRGVLLHYDGVDITPVELTGTASTATENILFKVWGSAEDDVMVVGTGGTALVYDGARWVLTRTNTADQLTTVHGRGRFEKYAVGGINQGLVFRYDGFSWTSIAEPFAPPISGVYAAEDGTVWVAGDGGYLASYDGVGWTQVDTAIFTQFHAVFAGPDEVVGVGGILTLSSEPRQGFIGSYAQP